MDTPAATMRFSVSKKHLSGPYNGRPGEESGRFYMWHLPRFAQTAGGKPLAGMTARIPASAVEEAPADADGDGAEPARYVVELPADEELLFQTRCMRRPP